MDSNYFSSLAQSLVALDAEKVQQLVKQGIQEQKPALDIINEALVKGLREMGDKFERGEVFIPHLMVAAEIVETNTDWLKPHLQQVTTGATKKKILICTVEGDIHELGKNLVATMLSISNYEVINLGRDIPNAQVIEAIRKYQPDLLYLSALMTTTMIRQQEIIGILNEQGLRDSVKVIVGGAPISQQWCDKIKADGYGMDAVEAVNIADQLSKAG